MATWKDDEPQIYFVSASLGCFVLAPSISLGLALLC